ncbi:RHS repeat-associated core domain-containing protein [Flavobacterium sp.]|uniref:RHS repeat-associated core domain-containing protein n=1 Tax=Flavobacterium sp. TaxID=239 RepID=UPI0035AF47CE
MIEQHSYSGDYTNRYKFNGKELDEETGFYYYGARYYNPKFSIWLSVDPLAEIMPYASPLTPESFRVVPSNSNNRR